MESDYSSSDDCKIFINSFQASGFGHSRRQEHGHDGQVLIHCCISNCSCEVTNLGAGLQLLSFMPYFLFSFF